MEDNFSTKGNPSSSKYQYYSLVSSPSDDHLKQRRHVARQQKQCMNCNDTGHLYRQCPKPLVSYGLLLYRRRQENNTIPANVSAVVGRDADLVRREEEDEEEDNESEKGSNLNEESIPMTRVETGAAAAAADSKTGTLEYVVICRRHSFGFIEVMRGHCSRTDDETLRNLVLEMTNFEREILLIRDFDWLWMYLWSMTSPEEIRRDKEYLDTRDKFNLLFSRASFVGMLSDLPFLWVEPEWGFPKGRKDKNESTLSCARREMMEETGIAQTTYNLLQDFSPVKETFKGTDSRLYSHMYYVAELKKDVDLCLEIDKKNLQQVREVSQVRWATLKEICSLVRPYNKEKLNMITEVDARLNERRLFLQQECDA